MRYKNPERVAWLVIVGSFVVFVLLCATVPFGIRYYLLHATSPQTTNLEVIDGTPTVRLLGAAAPIAVTSTMELSEGSTVETDENARCILTFKDGSTLILFPSTQITLMEMHVPTFLWGIEPTTVIVEEERGRVRVGAAPLIAQGDDVVPLRHLEIQTPHLAALLSDGSYAVEVSADSSQLIVTDGNAAVSSAGQTVNVGRRQRTVVTPGQPPLAALPAAQEIIVNGDFSDPLARGWDVVHDTTNPLGVIDLVNLTDRRAIHITRTGSNQTSAITGIIQTINREVSDYRTVQFSADVRVHTQSLSGGGILSSEYPLIVRMRYHDVYGSEAEWVHGFYIQNLTNNPTVNGEQIATDVWVPFESGNLLETLDPKPFSITSIQIYASGWDYDSYVAGVSLVVE